MEKNSLLNVYDHAYAGAYNNKFLLNPFSKISSDFELEILKGLVNEQTSWLDAGCGTGYFLSRFPGSKRAGMDISPGMLEEARKVNPDAVFFRQADFREDIAEWHNSWSLVSCMWYPYSYVESIGEVETVVKNLVSWTKPGGDLFIPVADLQDFRPSLPQVPYEENEPVYAGSLIITGYTWTWLEDDGGKRHVNMVAPHVDHMLRLMEPFFETIEVLRYPPAYEGWVSRRAILARNKREPADTGKKAKIVHHPVPAPVNAGAQYDHQAAHENIDPLENASHKQILKELLKRLSSGRTFKSIYRKLFRRDT